MRGRLHLLVMGSACVSHDVRTMHAVQSNPHLITSRLNGSVRLGGMLRSPNMAKPPKERTEAEIEKKRDAALTRALSMPPKPHKPPAKKSKPKAR